MAFPVGLCLIQFCFKIAIGDFFVLFWALTFDFDVNVEHSHVKLLEMKNTWLCNEKYKIKYWWTCAIFGFSHLKIGRKWKAYHFSFAECNFSVDFKCMKNIFESIKLYLLCLTFSSVWYYENCFHWTERILFK